MAAAFPYLRDDLARYHLGPRPLSLSVALRAIWPQPGFQAVAAYRFGRALGLRRRQLAWWPLALSLYPLFWMLQTWVRLAYDIHLDQNADIGPGLYVGHFGGIRLEACRIGRHCAVQQQVRAHPAADADGGPVIGDNVWIGAHATIIGPIRIGEQSTIGAGAVVTADVAPRCLVMGDPARVIRWDFDNSSFL